MVAIASLSDVKTSELDRALIKFGLGVAAEITAQGRFAGLTPLEIRRNFRQDPDCLIRHAEEDLEKMTSQQQ